MKRVKRLGKKKTKKREWFGLRTRMIMTVQAEILVCVGLSFLFNWLANDILKWGVPFWVELLVVSMMVGTGLTTILSKLFFNPIKELRKAIEKVADGDLSVKLEHDKHSSKEIQEIYSGFNLMTRELSSTEILKTDFVSNVSHEIKTPINAIEGYAMLIQDSECLSDGEREEYIDKIIYNTHRLSTLVGNVLLLSKIENQSLSGSKTSFRLDEQIRQSIMLLEPEWVKKDIEFDVEMDEVTVKGNEQLLHHVWYNLISNAVKFDPEGGLIRIRLSEKGSCAVFTVEDSGPGIEPEALKHIFDKFYQADSSHKSEGNGLGLSLVKRILDLSGGEIVVENIEGGCRFTVILKN